MCHASDYDHIMENAPSDEERAAMAAIDDDPEPRPRDVSGPFTEHTPTNLYDRLMAMQACGFCGRRGHHFSWHETPAQTSERVARERARDRSMASLPLATDALAFARSLR